MFKRILLFISILCVLILLAVIQAEPADLEVKASVNKNKVSLNDTIDFTVELNGDINSSPEIKLPDLKDSFNVLSSGQSQRFLIKADKSTTAMVYEYILQPKKAGKFTIGEVEVKFKEGAYKTQAIEIEVVEAPQEEKPIPDDIEEKLKSDQGVTI